MLCRNPPPGLEAAVHLDPGDPCGYMMMLLTCKCMKLAAGNMMVQRLAELPTWSTMYMVPSTPCEYMMLLPAEAPLHSALSDPCAHVMLPTGVFLGLPLGGPCKCMMLLACEYMMPLSCGMAVRLLMLLPTWSMLWMALNTPCKCTMLLPAETPRRVVLSDPCARMVPQTEVLLGLPPGGPCEYMMFLACECMMLLNCKMAAQLLVMLPPWSMLCMALDTPCGRTMLLSAGTLRRVAFSDPYAHMMLRTGLFLGPPLGGSYECMIVLACGCMMLIGCTMAAQLLVMLPTWSTMCMALDSPCERTMLLSAGTLRCVALSDPCARMMLQTGVLLGLLPGGPCTCMMFLACECVVLLICKMAVQLLVMLPTWSMLCMALNAPCERAMLLPDRPLRRVALNDPCARMLRTVVLLGLPPGGHCKCMMLLACDYMMLLSCKITVQLLMLLPTWSMLCMALTTPCKRVKLLLAVALRRVALSDPCARMMLWT